MSKKRSVHAVSPQSEGSLSSHMEGVIVHVLKHNLLTLLLAKLSGALMYRHGHHETGDCQDGHALHRSKAAVATARAAADLDGDHSAPSLVLAVCYAGCLLQAVGHYCISKGKVEGKLHPLLPHTHQVKEARHSCA